MDKFFVQTFGCRCNQADSANLRGGMCRQNFEETFDPRSARYLLINTCTVTHRTDQQVRQAVRRLHRENPEACVVVTGCYAQRDPQSLAAIPGVNLVVGNADKEHLPLLLRDPAVSTSEAIIRSPLNPGTDHHVGSGAATGGKTRPFVKIQDGCDARCSYCIIPEVRGPARSARKEDVLAEVRRLAELGYREIVLTGVHLGTFGRKSAHTTRLAELLRMILEIPGLGRLRLSSIEPMRFSRKILEIAAAYPAFAPHFHIPVQSGSDAVLRRMRRPYKRSKVLDLLESIREKLPSAAIGTDIIVGFPGETEKDFAATVDLVERSPLTYLHVFPFSARDGTDAARMPNPVDPAVIRERARALRQFSRSRNFEFRRRFVGQVLPALTLSPEEQMGETVVLTDNYIHARLEQSPPPPNRLVQVRLTRVHPDASYGALAD